MEIRRPETKTYLGFFWNSLIILHVLDCWFSSDEHIRLYEEKLDAIILNWSKRKEESRARRKKIRKTSLMQKRRCPNKRWNYNAEQPKNTETHNKTYGGKQGPFFRNADKETKEQHIQFELVNNPEKGFNR